MSIDTETALAAGWPIEVTEFAAIGDHVANLYTRTAQDTDPDQHFGVVVWNVEDDALPLFTMLGTTWPGKLYAYSPWCESRVSAQVSRDFAQLYADAGFYQQPPRVDTLLPEAPGAPDVPTWVSRPCVGDPRMDPTVLEEGCVVPWLQPGQLWTDLDDPTFGYFQPEGDRVPAVKEEQ